MAIASASLAPGPVVRSGGSEGATDDVDCKCIVDSERRSNVSVRFIGTLTTSSSSSSESLNSTTSIAAAVAAGAAGVDGSPFARFDDPPIAGESSLTLTSGVAVREGRFDPASNLALAGGPFGLAAFQDADPYLPSSVCQSPFDSSKTSSTLSGQVVRMDAKNLTIKPVSMFLDK